MYCAWLIAFISLEGSDPTPPHPPSLQSPRRQFIRTEIGHADYRQINIVDPLNDTFGVTGGETYSVYRGQQIDAHRWVAELHHGIRC